MICMENNITNTSWWWGVEIEGLWSQLGNWKDACTCEVIEQIASQSRIVSRFYYWWLFNYLSLL